MKRIQEIVENGYCTGCGLCASILGEGRITMRLSPLGYLRPYAVTSISDKESAGIQAVCPGINLRHELAQGSSDSIWGLIHSVRTGYSLNVDIRREGSSGGVLSALALYLLETGQVDFIAQIAVSETDPLTNVMQWSRTREDVLRAAGSRYAPSAPLASLEQMLLTGQRFALIGKPCDIAAVRRLANSDKRIKKQVPYLLSFMCAGVPSMKGTEELLHELGIDLSDLQSFRYRGDGWPGKARAVCRDGRVAEMDYATSWGTILNRHLQFRCKICPDGTGEFADVVCADAWYGKDGYPDFDERDGRSLILTRTPAGERLVRDAEKENAIKVSMLDIGELARMQPYQHNRKQVVLARLLATYLRRGWAPRFRRMNLLRAAITVNPMTWLRNAFGTYRRAEGERL